MLFVRLLRAMPCLVLLLLAGPVVAEVPVDFDALVVSGASLAPEERPNFQSVSVIDREQIERTPAASLADLLALSAGVDVRRRGGSNVQADIGIRGTGYEQTLILIDGVPFQNAQTGHHHMNLPVALAHIERIEILRGPGLLRFGSRGTGGAINIVTRAPRGPEAGVEARIGDHRYRGLAAQGGTAGTDVAHLLSVEHERSDGFEPDEPTDFDIRRAFYSGRYRAGESRWIWGLGADDRDFGAWKFYTADFPDQRERTEARLAYLTGQLEVGGWQLQPRLSVYRHDDEFRTRVGEALFVNEHETSSQDLGLVARTDWRQGTTELGVDAQRQRIDSNALGRQRREQGGVWLSHRRAIGERVELAGGLSRIHDSEFGGAWLPNAALHYRPAEAWTAFATVGRSSRPPSYTERFLQTGGNVGDPDLGAERALQRELGFSWQGHGQRLSGALFQRRISQAIDWRRPPGDTTWRAAAFDSQRSSGAELEWGWRPSSPGRLVRLDAALTVLDASIDDRGQEIKYALDYPRYSLNLAGRLALPAGFELDLSARHVRRSGGENAWLVAGRLLRPVGNFELMVEGNNLLDETITEAGFAPLPGRWLFAGVRWRM